MRTLRKVFVVLFLLCLLIPGTAFAQKLEKITVAKDGSMKDEQGKPVDRKLFALSTYDADGKSQMVKGKARMRPEAMYLRSDQKNLAALTPAQLKLIDEYVQAEKATYVARQKRKRGTYTAKKRTYYPRRSVTVATLSDDEMERLANKVASKITVPAPAGLTTVEFRREVDEIVANAKLEIGKFAASTVTNPNPLVTPGDTSFNPLVALVNAITWFFNSTLGMILLILLAIAMLIYSLPRAIRYWSDRRSAGTSSVLYTEEKFREKDGEILEQSTTSVKKSTTVSDPNLRAFESADPA